MDINELKDQVTAKLQEFEAVKQQHLEGLRLNLNKMLSEIFNNEKIQAIAWAQYTPYFNDGDECVFGVSEPYLVLSGFDPEDIPDDVYQFDDDDVYVTYAEVGDHLLGIYKERAAEAGPHQDMYIQKYKALMDMKTEYGDVEPYWDALNDILKEEELLRSLYGDHVQVVVHRGGVEVFEYEHD